LLDLNVLIALAEPGHTHFQRAQEWFKSSGAKRWGVCPLTEAGFIRVTTNPVFNPGPRTMGQAIAVLEMLKANPRYWYWGIEDSWVDLAAPFAARISGHQQVTDAYLLGLAIKEDGVLVTFDRRIRYMAGREFAGNLLVLE
jgi:toxin-antitoxin system PIN domain toxin